MRRCSLPGTGTGGIGLPDVAFDLGFRLELGDPDVEAGVELLLFEELADELGDRRKLGHRSGGPGKLLAVVGVDLLLGDVDEPAESSVRARLEL